MKNKILTTCLQGNYRGSLGEFNNTSCDMFGAERVKFNQGFDETLFKLNSLIYLETCLVFLKFFWEIHSKKVKAN